MSHNQHIWPGMHDIKKKLTTTSSFVFANNRGIKNIATQIILVKLETYMNHIKESHLMKVISVCLESQNMSESIFNVERVFTEL